MSKKKSKPAKPVTAKSEIQSGGWKPDLKTLYSILLLAAVALYANTIGHHYALDDEAVIVKNKFVTSGIAGIKNILTTPYLAGFWDINSVIYRPLPLILFALEWQFFPNNPHFAHVVSILLYACTALFLFTLLRQLLKNFSVTVPFICTLLFVAHPLHTEAVANIKSGDEILCFLFFILSSISFLKYIDTGKKSSLISSCILFFLCLLSKESGMTFLVVFPLLAYFFRGNKLMDGIKKSLIFLVPVVVVLLLHQFVVSQSENPPHQFTYKDNSLVAAPNSISRLATAIFINGDYIKLLFFPLNLSADYSFNQIKPVTFLNIQVILSVAFLAWMGFFIFKNFKSRNEFAFALIYYLVTISLVSNVFFLIGAVKAERLLFAPSLAFCLVAGIAGHKYLARKTFLTAAVVLFSLYCIRSISRNADWKNNLVLFQKDVKTSPESANTHYNYGILHMDSIAMKARDPEVRKRFLLTSAKELEEAVRIDPLSEDAYKVLGQCYYYLEDYQRSIESSKRSMSMNPADTSIYADLGNAYFRNNNFKEAIEALSKAIEGGYVDKNTYNYLGSSYFKTGDYQSAINQFNKSLETYPDDDDVLINLGAAYATIKDYDKAVIFLNQSLKINPSNPRAYQYLGVVYEEMGKKEEAAENFAKAERLTGGVN